MTTRVENRCRELGQHIIDTGDTIRQTAKVYGISKSTVHIDVTKRLQSISPAMARDVNKILQNNKATRHIRGGEATKEKYLKMKND